jgi:hypothetical protein
MALDVNYRKTKKLPGQPPMPQSGLCNDLCFGFFGMVTELHPEDNTVHVRTNSGLELSGLRVASLEWVTIDEEKGFLSGERRLPPVNTYVFCVMPTGDPASALVLCSAFGYQAANHAAFKEDSEDAKFIKKQVDNAGWVRELDYRTGTRSVKNHPEGETIKIEVDQEEDGNEKVTITIHSNIFTVDKDNGIKIETEKNVDIAVKGNATVNVDGDLSAEVKGNATIKADGDLSAEVKGNATLKVDGDLSAEAVGKANIKSTGAATVESSADVSAKGVNVTVEASAMITLKSGDAAAWMPNCVPVCPFGMPHGGPSAGIVKLKGG